MVLLEKCGFSLKDITKNRIKHSFYGYICNKIYDIITTFYLSISKCGDLIYMKSNIVISKDQDKIYEKWVKKVIEPFGFQINYKNKEKYNIKSPIDTIYVLDESEYEYTHSEIRNSWRGIEPDKEFYKGIKGIKKSKLKSLLSEQPTVVRDIGPAFWVKPTKSQKISETVNIQKGKSYIIICPEKIKNLSIKLEPGLHELRGQDLTFKVFRVALIHELGHHYSYANLSKKQISILINSEDLNISEGLANWFAYIFLSKGERYILAENSIRQKPRYRNYFILRYADVSKILNNLYNNDDILSAIQEFSQTIGGKLDLNGKLLSIQTKATGFMMDWSDKGGKIIAGEYIQALGPMKSGCFITPKIEFLIGRFPSDTLIVTNEILRIEDYDTLPPNIVIIPKEEVDIHSIIRRYPHKKDEDHLKSILTDIGMLDKYTG
jgi:hypothetical protein